MTFLPTGISPSRKLPGTIVEVRYAQGSGSSANLDRDILLIGDMKTGSATPDDEVYEIKNENEAIALFGQRSEIHRMARQIFKLNRNARVFGVGLTESTGNAATGTLTLAGTATTAGSVDVHIAGTKVSVGFAVGDGYAAVADGLCDAINAISYLPVTAVEASGVITLTAVNAGTPGNSIALRETVSGAGVTCVAVAMSSGSSESDITDALAAIENREYYYQVLARNDATNVQAHIAQLKLLAEPSTQIRQVGVFAHTGTVATASAIAMNSAANSERMQCVQLNAAETMACEIAAMQAALRAKYEISDWGYNFNGMPLPVKGPASSSDNPTNSNLETALASGLAPLSVDKFGGVSLVASRTTRCLNGTDPDHRVSQSYIVSVTDAWAKQIQSDLALSFKGKKVANDNAKAMTNLVQPKNLRVKIIKWIKEYTERPWLDPAMLDTMIESVQVDKSTATLSAQVVLYCAENLDQTYLVALESSDPQ